MRLTKIPAVFIICIGLAISSVAKADEACVTPSGYYYNEGLEFNISNVFSQINPRLNLNLYLSTEDNLSQYQNTSKPKLFPDGEIIIYLPTQYANRERTSGTGGSSGGGTFNYTGVEGNSAISGTVTLGSVNADELSGIEKILPQTFPKFKRGLLRHGYVSNFILTDDYSKKFSQQFNQLYKTNLVNLKNLGTIVNESFSFATMGVTTHKINGKDIKYARTFGAVYNYRTEKLQYILISKKLSNEQDNSEVQQIQKDFQNIMTSIRNCLYTPNIGSRFAENYKNSIYEGEIQSESTATASSATAATSSARDATINGAAQVRLAADQVTLATTQATNAATSATNAATSATTANTQASKSTTQAKNAATSATTATTQASTATTQATNAASSATEAAASATAAAASADSFDDTYLGAKSFEPSVDNDGDALTEGDMYFNTKIDRLRVYDGSIWLNVALGAATVVSETSATTEPFDYIEKLKEIKSLLDTGIINEEDFEKMKQKIIDNMN